MDERDTCGYVNIGGEKRPIPAIRISDKPVVRDVIEVVKKPELGNFGFNEKAAEIIDARVKRPVARAILRELFVK